NILSVVQNNPSSFDQHRRSFSTLISQTSRKPSFISHHPSDESEDKSIDLNGKDIDYSVLYNETVEDFSFTSTRKQA
ncbi:unnamed protein product, partial [Rotaria sordida]